VDTFDSTQNIHEPPISKQVCQIPGQLGFFSMEQVNFGAVVGRSTNYRIIVSYTIYNKMIT
jgi:hypothetical protein